jgi:hypothetical protein
VLFLPWPADDLDRIEAAFIRTLRPILNGKRSSGIMCTPAGEGADSDVALIASVSYPRLGVDIDHKKPECDQVSE